MNPVAQQLEAVFNDIAATRMAGLPICNETLRVQAVGFREWQQNWLGVLITPWTISLVLLPGAGGLRALGADEKQAWDFPSGKYEFMGLNEPALGNCQVCSLISPVNDIGRHEDAVAIAGQVMEALFQAPHADSEHAADSKQSFEAARLKGEPVLDKTLSRRAFLRGNFLGT